MRVEVGGVAGQRMTEIAQGPKAGLKESGTAEPAAQVPGATESDRRCLTTPEELQQAIERMNRVASLFPSSHLRFSIDTEARRIRVKVVDDRTGEVLRVIPPASFLENFEKMSESIGFLFDDRV